MLRKIVIRETVHNMIDVQAEGAPPDLWPLVTEAMNHNRTVANIFLTAVIEYCRGEGIDMVELSRRAKLGIWIPPNSKS